MRALPQALGIIFEVQIKKSNEKIAKRKKGFQLTKRVSFLCFCFFLTPPTFKAFIFLMFCSS